MTRELAEKSRPWMAEVRAKRQETRSMEVLSANEPKEGAATTVSGTESGGKRQRTRVEVMTSRRKTSACVATSGWLAGWAPVSTGRKRSLLKPVARYSLVEGWGNPIAQSVYSCLSFFLCRSVCLVLWLDFSLTCLLSLYVFVPICCGQSQPTMMRAEPNAADVEVEVVMVVVVMMMVE